MYPAHVIRIVTPKRVVLNGLWFGPRKPRRVLVWIHGLSGSAFSNGGYLSRTVDRSTAVLTFNNRGHDIVSGVRYANGTFGSPGGEVHEVFTDCVDDIEGAVRFARRCGAKEIFVGGSSTGSQKTVYWASHTKRLRNVCGYVLAVPLSDHASAVALHGGKKVQRALASAQALIRKGKPHAFLPEGLWHQAWDAQRFVSLYGGEGPEETFPYWNTKQQPHSLRRLRQPILVLLAGNDEYSDRPAKEIGDWFAGHLKVGDRVVIVPRVGHGFTGGERLVAAEVCSFMRAR